MDLTYRELFPIFQAEAEEGLAVMEQTLVLLEHRPDDAELLNTLFRMAHTLKGNADSLGIRPMTEVAHVAEDVLHGLRARTLRVTRERVDVLLQSVDVLRAFLAMSVERPAAGDAPADLLARLREAAAGADGAGDVAPVAAAEAGPVLESPLEAALRTQRVDVLKLDRLLDLVTEIAVDRGRLRETLRGTRSSRDLAALEESEHLYGELHDLVMRARLVPLRPMLAHFARVTRDLALATGKPARLSIDERHVELDMRVAERLRDALTHMIRNAFDHGVEPAAVRQSLGKDPIATLTLRARHDAGGVVIQLSDDGTGLNRARILARAVARGLASEGETLGDKAVYELVFAPGFSTAETITERSGRGVGLDVVRRNVEALRGTVEVDSAPGEGTTLTLRLPLMLAMVEALAVNAAGRTYLIPMERIDECVDLPGDGETARRTGVFEWQGRPLPLLPLAPLFGHKSTPSRPRVVVVRQEGGGYGLIVDALLRTERAVVRPLSQRVRGLPVFAGSTILGDGQVALLLDVDALVSYATAAARS
jgi:two-component system, chemotaxis family, sensor kinase CheA